MKLVALVATAPVVAVGLAFGFAPRATLSTTIEIAAPPSRVWAALVDTADYDKWNPNMRLIGSLVPGATIQNIEGEGEDQMTFWPTVLVVRPDQELRWFGRYKMPGVFDAEHSFLLRRDAGGTELTQGERIRGIALWFYDVEQLRPRFASLNSALKARAELNARID